MEKTESDYSRGLDKGLQMALDVINATAKTQFRDIAEVALYLHNPEEYGYFKNQTEKESS